MSAASARHASHLILRALIDARARLRYCWPGETTEVLGTKVRGTLAMEGGGYIHQIRTHVLRGACISDRDDSLFRWALS